MKSFSGRGLVMTTGNYHYKYARHSNLLIHCLAILALRKMGCQLPVQLFYKGKGDLLASSIAELEEINGVEVIVSGVLISL